MGRDFDPPQSQVFSWLQFWWTKYSHKYTTSFVAA